MVGIRETVELHGHRGARGLRPENTLPGFAHAAELGVDVIELDVGLSADGVVVLGHDQVMAGARGQNRRVVQQIESRGVPPGERTQKAFDMVEFRRRRHHRRRGVVFGEPVFFVSLLHHGRSRRGRH